mgnify:CR=1 FL=1
MYPQGEIYRGRREESLADVWLYHSTIQYIPIVIDAICDANIPIVTADQKIGPVPVILDR